MGPKVFTSLLLFLLVILVAYPAGALIFGSFWSSSPGLTGGFTLENYTDAFTFDIPAPLTSLLLNTLLIGVSSATISVIVGFLMAYLLIRTNVPFSNWYRSLILVPRAFPGIVAAIAWIYLLSPSIGILNLLTREYIGKALFNIYTFEGVIMLTTSYELPITFLLASNALQMMDTSLEEQAKMSGAGLLRTFFTVVLPLFRPLLFSVWILFFIISMLIIDIPVLIGLPGKVYTLNSAIFFIITSVDVARIEQRAFNIASALGSIVVAIVVILLLIYIRTIRNAERFVTTGGKARLGVAHDIGLWRYVVFGLFCLFLFFVVILPAFVVGFISFSRYFTRPSLGSFGELTTLQWQRMFSMPEFHRALTNSLFLAAIGALAATLIAFCVAYVVLRAGRKEKAPIESLATLPLSYPSTIFAMGILWGFIITPIYATIWIILLYYIAHFLPFSVRTVSPFLYQLHREFEEASWTSGASRMYTIFRLILPMIRGGLFSVWVLTFQILFREFGGSIILFSYGSEVLATFLYERAITEGNLGIGGSVGVIMLVVSLALSTIALRMKVARVI